MIFFSSNLVKLDLDLDLDPDPDPHSEKLLDPDPHKVNADPQPCFQYKNSKKCTDTFDFEVIYKV